jgi:hypothetical protein
MKLALIKTIINTIIFTLFILFIILTAKTHASENPILIGCIYTPTNKIIPMTPTGNCYLGKNWQNIMLPPREDMKVFLSMFSENETINRLPIVNFESWFRETAGNSVAQWYVQTKRVYNISPKIKPQLEWLKKRMESQKKGNCSHNKSENNILKCLYARHFGALTKDHWYVKKAFATKEYYKTWFKLHPEYFSN